MVGFQSLLHQGISLLILMRDLRKLLIFGFQSLLHQGISLLRDEQRRPAHRTGLVSIPSSSGHQFTGPWPGAVPHCAGPFQSLLHQGISLLENLSVRNKMPLRITVSIPSSSGHQFTAILGLCAIICSSILVSIPSSSGHQFTEIYSPSQLTAEKIGFQSLLHQGISLLLQFFPYRENMDFSVSIPSSSGHQFTGSSRIPRRHGTGTFQSLLHQGISLLE